MTIHHFPTPQAEPNHVWPPVRQTYSPLPRGMAAFGEPFTPLREKDELCAKAKAAAWIFGGTLGYLAAAGLAMLLSVVW